MKRILKFQIPVDGQAHHLDTPSSGELLFVAARVPGKVDFWIMDSGSTPWVTRTFRVFGTGEPIEEKDGFVQMHQGSAVTSDGHLVRHLMEEIEDWTGHLNKLVAA